MKEYKVELIKIALKTNVAFKAEFQDLLNYNAKQGYTLHSFSMHPEFCTVIFERVKDQK